ncbi:MAG: effector binding domain-containing protein [Clostridiaceae bacterium]
MELATISEVTKRYGISTRTLRYYEQIGLLTSLRKEDYAYRVYDGACCRRLSQILLLRKLRIPLKQIQSLLHDASAASAVAVFEKNIASLDEEISSLRTVRDILTRFVYELREKSGISLGAGLLEKPELLAMLMPLQKRRSKEEPTMTDLNQANANLTKLADRDVRIIYLSPMTVAALHIMGATAENEGAGHIRALIEENGLVECFPQMRHFGFNHPDGTMPDMSDHGYERWISVPDDIQLASPFRKKHFDGGLYASYTIPMGAFEEWQYLYDWVEQSEKYELAPGDSERMHGCLEEHLNLVNNYILPPGDSTHQLDLLIPIRMK